MDRLFTPQDQQLEDCPVSGVQWRRTDIIFLRIENATKVGESIPRLVLAEGVPKGVLRKCGVFSHFIFEFSLIDFYRALGYPVGRKWKRSSIPSPQADNRNPKGVGQLLQTP